MHAIFSSTVWATRLHLTPWLVLSAFLAACGGGGGGGDIAPPAPVSPPVITQQPASQAVEAGTPVTFAVGLQDGTGASYQWLRNGAEVAGATQSATTLAAPAVADSGSKWSVRVSNAGGAVTSSEAVLTVTPKPVVTPVGISLVAGDVGAMGNADGTGRNAHFNNPRGIATDAQGNVYVADAGNHTIRMVTPQGAVTTVAGTAGQSGTADGAGAAARFSALTAVTLGLDGAIYILDNGGLRRMTAAGAVTTIGLQITGTAPRFLSLAAAADGAFFIASESAIWRVRPGEAATVHVGFPTSGTANGDATQASFLEIADIALDAAQNIYVAQPRTHMIRKVTPQRIVSTFAGSGALGSVDGTGTAAIFSGPTGLAVDGLGNIWVAETGSGALRKISPAGVVTTPFGAQGLFPLGSGASSLALNAAGDIYYCSWHGVAKVDPSGAVADVAGNVRPAAVAGIGAVRRLAVDGAGNVVQGTAQSELLLQKRAPDGALLPFSVVVPGYGVMNSTPLNGIATDPAGNVYVSSLLFTHGGINFFTATGGSITKVSTSGATSTVANWPIGSPGAMAPGYLTRGPDGALYFIDMATGNLVRWTEAAGATVLGQAIQLLPGGLFSMALDRWSIAVDASGRVAVVGNRAIRVVQSGALVVLAGAPGQAGSQDGEGAQARFVAPTSMVGDAAGNLYVADGEVVRKVTTTGTVSTVAGVRGSIGLRTGALPGSLNVLGEIAIGPDGVLYAISGDALIKIKLQ
ncbi:MAG: hypothetical protein EOO25_08085 [Comamonadaceae bacterium]|nr:MAG: hypothetical protein EOO25_08085 [Comamonadaceae bacterium]